MTFIKMRKRILFTDRWMVSKSKCDMKEVAGSVKIKISLSINI